MLFLNFSHKVPEAQLPEGVRQVMIACQLDMSRDLYPQVSEVISAAENEIRSSGDFIWAIQPPALSIAAYWVGSYFALAISDAMCPRPTTALWMRRSEDGIRFEVGGVE